MSRITHFTPPIAQLFPFYKVRCSQPGCDSVFLNVSHLQLHLLKRHKVVPANEARGQTVFHCPVPFCAYHVEHVKAKQFKNLKYLRQHFQKVHATKLFACPDCEKAFATLSLLQWHQKKECGITFICPVCQVTYDTLGSLQTHMQRKQHSAWSQPATKQAKKKVKTASIGTMTTTAPPPERCTKSTQTAAEQLEKDPKSQPDNSNSEPSAPTNFMISTPPEMQLVKAESHVCDSKSQTSDAAATDLFGQLPLCSIETQTCDDILSALGLTDIETQTHWSFLNDCTDAATSISNCFGMADGVSTQTQTNFHACDGETMHDCQSSLHPIGCDCPFGPNLYNTQCTQTCDELLEGLFDAQESDLISTFQSAYTQT